MDFLWLKKNPYIRVFISSPGDVNAERKIALDAIEYLPNRPAYREKVAFRVVAWDKPGAGTAMLGTLSPQEAINRGLPKPSECDIVIVLFWSRMGTPFTDTDGKDYLSGTHWEIGNVTTITAQLWQGSSFPGLRAFTEKMPRFSSGVDAKPIASFSR